MPAKSPAVKVVHQTPTKKVAAESPVLAEKATEELRLPGTGLDPVLVEKAVLALLKHHEKQAEKSEKKSLLGNDRPFQVQFTLQRVPGKSSPKPIRVMIPHPLFQLAENKDAQVDEPEICLIVKEESKQWVQEMIEKFPKEMGCIKKVLGLQSLRKKHAQYEQQRELLHKYNVFLADDRILPMLTKALGKTFFKAKKLPIPIALTRKEALPFAVQKALSATFMTISDGTCITIRAGHTGMSPKKLIENVVAIAENAVPKIPRKWTNIQMIGIKTPESVSLPIYNKTPEALAELAKLAGYQTKSSSSSSDKKEGTKDEDKDSKRKHVDPAKSPLLRALKKQKQMEEEEEKGDKEKNNSGGKESDDKTPAKAVVKATGKIEGEASAVQETPKGKKNKRKSSEADMKQPEEKSPKTKLGDSPASTTKGKPDDNNTPKQKEKRAKRKSGEGLEKEGSSATKQVETKSAAPAKESKSKLAKETKDFIVAKKFTGSKEGYAFRMGGQGLGYYVDVKPVVDKMAMDALKRSSQSQGSRGGGNKRKGRRSY